MKTLIATTIFSSMVMNANAASVHDNCSLQFKDDLVIAANDVRLQRANQDLWRIDDSGSLWLEGKKVNTDATTTQSLKDYQHGLRTQGHAVVGLVADAMQMAATAVDKVVQAFGGENPQLQASVDQAIGTLKQHVDTIVVQQGRDIRINGSKVNNADGQFEQEFEQAVEQSMMKLTGAMMMAMGQSMSEGNGDFESKMTAFGAKMDKFGEDLEVEMQQKSDGLEARGEQICTQLRELDVIEQQIQAQVPAMKVYDLIDTSKEGIKAPKLGQVDMSGQG
jgi:hypothetical protein